MKIISTIQEWRSLNLPAFSQADGSRLGFVPTMGALHPGHASLFRRAHQENTSVVASIFVNPTQFNNSDDFQKYPKTWESDLAVLEKEKVDYVFAPTADEIYFDKYNYQLTEKELSQKMEGQHRPGHFDGVLTVVMKLFQIIQPSTAYFGEKDYQQLQLISGMVRSFFLPITIVPCPTLREADGLAMSSRNLRLSESARAKAPQIYKALKAAKSAEAAQQFLKEQGFDVDYVKDEGRRRFVAAQIEHVRLIDNVEI